MPPLVKQQLFLTFRNLETKKSSRQLPPGKLTAAKDVVQRTQGIYEKRYGVSALDTTTDTGSITTGVDATYVGSFPVLRTADTVFVRNVPKAKWVNTGVCTPTLASYKAGISAAATKPFVALANGYAYYFSKDYSTSSGASHVYVRIVEEATGQEIVPTTVVTSMDDAFEGSWIGDVHVANGVVLVLYVINAATTASLRIAKFDPSTPSATPTSTTTLHTVGTSGSINSAGIMLTASMPLIVSSGGNLNGTAGISVCVQKYDTSTNAVSTTNVTGVTAGAMSCWLQGPSEGPTTYSLVAAVAGGSDAYTRYDVTYSSLAVSAGVSLGTTTAQSPINMTAWRNSSGDVWIWRTGTSGATTSDDYYVTVITKPAAGALSLAVLGRGQALASRTLTYNGVPLILTAVYDTSTLLNQSGYILRNGITGLILGRVLHQGGGNLYQLGNTPITGSGALRTTLTRLVLNSTTILGLVTSSLDGPTYSAYRFTFDMSPTLGEMLPATSSHGALIPGAWPMVVDARFKLQEFGLPMWPRTPTVVSSGSGTTSGGVYLGKAVYRKTDIQGNVYRSAPSAQGVSATIAAGAGVKITAPTLRVLNDNTETYVDFYLSKGGGVDFYYIGSVKNDPTVDTVSLTATAEPGTTAKIYTTGNALSNVYPSQWKIGCEWRNRLFLGGVGADGVVWYTQESDAMTGPQFNDAVLLLQILDGTGDVTAMAPVDTNFMALFKKDAIFIIDGDGPDGLGNGGYSPRRLPYNLGCVVPASLVSTPLGVMFQGTDGLIWLLDRNLTLTCVGAALKGSMTSTAYTVTSSVYISQSQQAHFHCAGQNTKWVLDMANPPLVVDDENSGVGSWYQHTGAVIAGLGSFALDGIPYHVQSDGKLYREIAGQYYDGPGTAIQPSLTLAAVNFGGILGYGRLYRALLRASGESIAVTVNGELHVTPVVAPEYEFRPGVQKMTSITLTVAATGGSTTANFTFEGVVFEVGVKGAARLNISRRI